ncbi:MAG: cation:proton antiporter [Rickettsiaceae bacterium]|nr:cation:proton antiporter [Rickettsiaceae bacterium]
MSMLNLCLVLMLIFSSLVICGALMQKDIFIKLLFLNTGTSLGALFMCFLGSIKVNSSYIDIALIYFLLSVVINSAYLKYFMHKHKRENIDAS